jgi:hypothetical protein
MPGTYAHITLADTLSGDADGLDTVDTLTPTIKHALLEFLNYCELGAVSPDYPYLALLDEEAAGWANAMHYYGTADFVRRAVPYICKLTDRVARRKCIAWLFGFASHVVADLTIHPIVNLKVGPYEKHKAEHRLCEMHQDVYIFHQMGLGDIGDAEYIKRAGIASCVDEHHALDPMIVDLWVHCLDEIPMGIDVKPGIKGPTAKPDPREWHQSFVSLIDGFAEEGRRLPPLSRHFCEDRGLVYPAFSDLNMEFIENLRTPEGTTASYDVIFKRARDDVKQVWQQLGQALTNAAPEQFVLANADLDTGMDAAGRLLFWSVAV